jgi:hypothetical protein
MNMASDRAANTGISRVGTLGARSPSPFTQDRGDVAQPETVPGGRDESFADGGRLGHREQVQRGLVPRDVTPWFRRRLHYYVGDISG